MKWLKELLTFLILIGVVGFPRGVYTEAAVAGTIQGIVYYGPTPANGVDVDLYNAVGQWIAGTTTRHDATHGDGYYKLEVNIPTGNYFLQASYEGNEESVQLLFLGGTYTIDIYIEEAVQDKIHGIVYYGFRHEPTNEADVDLYTISGTWIAGTTTYHDATYGDGYYKLGVNIASGIYILRASYQGSAESVRVIFQGGTYRRDIYIKMDYDVNYIDEGAVRFSFVVVTDIHKQLTRLQDVVYWVNSHLETYQIRFVMVLGDFSTCRDYSIDVLTQAKQILDSLNVPYMPIPGNHEIADPAGGYVPDPLNAVEEAFNDNFEPVILDIGNRFPEFERATTPVWNTEGVTDRDSYFQNYAFDVVGQGWRYHFVCLDFCCRKDDGVGSDWWIGNADQHDFAGGTKRWLGDHLNSYLQSYPNMENGDNVFLFSHHPPSRAIFGSADFDGIVGTLMQWQNAIGYWFAGHTHMGEEYVVEMGVPPFTLKLCRAIVTDAVGGWSSDNGHFRVVCVRTPSGDISSLCGTFYDGYGGPLTNQGPYTAFCDVEVPEGKTLTVQAGAQVYFRPGFKIIADGVLDANGESNYPIYLISLAAPHRGIKLKRDMILKNGGEFKPGP